MEKPKPLRLILEKALKGLEIDVPLKTYSLWGAWSEVVGETIALQTQPRSVRNRILFIDVSHPTWMQQLQFLKSTLLEKINAFLGEPLIQDIRFRLGKIKQRPLRPPLEADDWREGTVDGRILERMEALLQKVGDAEIRETLLRVMVKGAKLKRYRDKLK